MFMMQGPNVMNRYTSHQFPALRILMSGQDKYSVVRTLGDAATMDDLGKTVDGIFESRVETVDEHQDASIRCLAHAGAEPGFCGVDIDLLGLQRREIPGRIRRQPSWP